MWYFTTNDDCPPSSGWTLCSGSTGDDTITSVEITGGDSMRGGRAVPSTIPATKVSAEVAAKVAIPLPLKRGCGKCGRSAGEVRGV